MPRNPRGSWGRRLLWTQMAVVAAMAATTVLTALLVGPAWFRMHMLEAGHAQPDVVEHAQQAFHDAGLVSLAVGLGTAMLAALGVATVLNRNLSRGVEALVDGAQHVAAGHYDQPVMMTSASPELAQVADAFNHMASQIASTEQTRRRMLTDLGHELRTPLAATQVTLEGLQDGVVDFTPANVEILLRQNQRLAALAADISEVSRAEEGRIPLSLSHQDLDQIVTASVAAARHAYDAAGVTLHAQTVPGLRVDVDAARIGQVLDNLLRNALQHTVGGNRVEVAMRHEHDRAVVRVTDNGAGIPTEAGPGIDETDRGRVFERFYRVEDTRTRDVDGGTGVGLAISRAIARAHGGDLTAHSDGPGHGATFALTLPTVTS